MSIESVTNPTYEFALYEPLGSEELTERIQRVRREMGRRLLILGHHYQQDDVIAQADLRGDSLGLSQSAADDAECRAIVFCGVHFMAETADVLANRPEQVARRGGRIPVVLPDLAAGCQLADMARAAQVKKCWNQLAEVLDTDDLTPITYVNSAAALKAFCGRHGGIVCTSTNARSALEWALKRKSRVLFFPDQHLGRNTARAMGIPLEEMPLWDPHEERLGGNTEESIRRGRVLLWHGYCGVHQRFEPQHIDYLRRKHPGIKVIVHPECMSEVVEQADLSGSTSRIIREIEQSPPGTKWAVGTEPHLVNRLRREHPEQEIHLLSTAACLCTTMFRINLTHLCWAVENLAAGTPVNVIEVEPETARWALVALQRMLEVR
jgi:quinolinate synthase